MAIQNPAIAIYGSCYGHLWTAMALLYEYPFMAIYCPVMAIYGSLWPSMDIYGPLL